MPKRIFRERLYRLHERTTMTPPKVSILMPVYNGAKYLYETLDSIFSQTYKNFELIILEDCSNDNSLEIIKSYNDLRVRIYTNDKNMGQTCSLNKGLKLAKGEYIAIHDQDDISLPERLQQQVEFLDNNTEIPLVGTQGESIDKNGNILEKYKLPINPESIYLSLLLGRSSFIHSSITFRKMVILDEFSGYDESYRFFQDYDLYSRVSVKYEMGNINDFCLQHRVHKSSASISNIHLCNDDAIKITSHSIYSFLKIEMNDIVEYSTTLRLFKPVSKFIKVYDITDKILINFIKRYPNAKRNVETREIIANTYFKIADIYSFNRLASLKSFLLFKQYSFSKKIINCDARLFFLWFGGAEIRVLFRCLRSFLQH